MGADAREAVRVALARTLGNGHAQLKMEHGPRTGVGVLIGVQSQVRVIVQRWLMGRGRSVAGVVPRSGAWGGRWRPPGWGGCGSLLVASFAGGVGRVLCVRGWRSTR